MATVYSYIRFSTKKQEHGDSLRRQRALSDRWIEKNGHIKGNLTLEDTGVSAFRGKNRHEGQLKRFLDEVEAGTVKKGSILIVENLDRLSREGIHPALALFGKILNAGIDIVVLSPYEQRYTKSSANDLVSILIPLINFYLANLQSKDKSDRLKEAWKEKRNQASQGIKFNRRCPSWLAWDDDKQNFIKREGWEAIPAIFRMSADGFGHHRILAELQKSYKPLGRSKRWNGSFLNVVLTDRSVLGELQPMEMDEEGNRVSVGQPILDYYPRIIDESLWYQSKAARQTRLKQKGPSSQFTNLFSGLIVCSQDQSQMHVQSSPDSRGQRVRRLVSYKHKLKEAGACPVSLEYDRFESAVLEFLSEIESTSLQPKHDDSLLQAKIAEKTGIVARLNEIQETLADPDFSNVKSLVSALKSLENKLAAIDEEIEKLEQKSHRKNPLKDTQSILTVLNQTTDVDERERMRIKLRMLIPEVVSSIWVKPERYKAHSVAIVQINFHDGGFKHLVILPDKTIGQRSFKIAGTEFKHLFADMVPIDDMTQPMGYLFWSARKIMENADKDKKEIPKEKPKTIGEAGKKWLVIKSNELEYESYKTVPATIQRVVKAIGRDLPCEDLNKQKWGSWKRKLAKMVSDGELGKATARVTYNRSKELLAWMFQEGLVAEWEGWKESAANVLA